MLLGILGFILTIGILVTLHEWGHFYVARCFNVKIIRFSLGFGKPLWTWVGKKDGTKYTLAPIPLGGYVAMLGEQQDEEIAPEDKGRTFHEQAAWKRFLIVAAGPVINLLFAIVAFGALYVVGVEGLRPQVVHVAPASYADKAGLRAGDEIMRIAGREVHLSYDAAVALLSAPLREDVMVEIQRAGETKALRLDLSALQAGDEKNMARATGLYVAGEWYPVQIGEVLPDSPATALGLQAGDEIQAIDGKPIDFFTISDWIRAHAGQQATLTVLRADERLTLHGTIGSRELNAQTVGYLGVRFAAPDFTPLLTVERYGVGKALWMGWEKTKHFTELTWQFLGRMLVGTASLDNVGGPMSIGDMAGKSLRYGVEVFLNFLGVVSLSLAALNLLPIPALDGGHMMLCLMEMVRGKALSSQAQMWLNRVGVGVLYTFMLFVLYKDFWRYFGHYLGGN